jgi:putative Mg2+ transporter-C (MgtC) family protein
LDPLQHIGGAREVLARLGVATLIGGVIGLNRDLRGKPAGVRTHSLVALGAALLTVLSLELGWMGDALDRSAVSRTIQGLITGIGFLGAGVILRNESQQVIHGLTTAASIWLVSCFGIACGLGQWITALAAVGLTLLVLLFGGPLERAFHRKLPPAGPPPPSDSPGPLH